MRYNNKNKKMTDSFRNSETNNKICIVTPIWKDKLTINELQNIYSSLKINNHFDHFFLHPDNLDLSFYSNKFPRSKFVEFEDVFFKNIKGYNILMQSSFFYEKFMDFCFMLVLQTDAILIKKIDELTNSHYDYIGAPWENGLIVPRFIFKNKILSMLLRNVGFNMKCYVGNGGLSLRRVAVFYETCNKYLAVDWLNEDMKFALLGKKNVIRIPEFEHSKKYFFEKTNDSIKCLPNVLGYHAVERYYPNLYAQIFKK